MAEFLISKQDDRSPTGWRPVTVVQALTTDDLREVVRQGFEGPGRYAISRWDNRREFNMGQGAPSVEDVAPPT